MKHRNLIISVASVGVVLAVAVGASAAFADTSDGAQDTVSEIGAALESAGISYESVGPSIDGDSIHIDVFSVLDVAESEEIAESIAPTFEVSVDVFVPSGPDIANGSGWFPLLLSDH